MDMKFVWLIVANILIYLLVRASKKKKWLNNIFTILFTTLVTLTIIEGAYRLFFKKAGPTESGNFGSSFNTPVELTGFTVKNIPDLQVTKKDAKGNLLYETHYSIIQDSGFNTLPINHRIGYHTSDATRDSVEFVFLGCSFTYATGVPDKETMAYRTGQAFNYNSLNLGGSGFGTHQAYQIFTHKYVNVPDKKKRVFIYTFIPDHLLRAKCVYSWCINDPYFVVESDSLKLLGPAYKNAPSGRAQTMVRLFSLNRALSIVSDLGNNIAQAKGAASANDDDYKRIALMLDKINTTAQQRGDKVIILHWDDYKGSANPKGGYYVDINKINAIFSDLSKKGAAVINASSFFNFTEQSNLIPQDNHPSSKGNQLMADKMVETLKSLGIY